MRINCELNANDFSLQDCIRPYRFLSEFRSNLVICCPATPFGLRTKLDFLPSHQFITFILNCQTNYLMWAQPTQISEQWTKIDQASNSWFPEYSCRRIPRVSLRWVTVAWPCELRMGFANVGPKCRRSSCHLINDRQQSYQLVTHWLDCVWAASTA